MPSTPYMGLTSAWVASAPTRPSAWMQRAPTAKNRDATAAPKAPRQRILHQNRIGHGLSSLVWCGATSGALVACESVVGHIADMHRTLLLLCCIALPGTGPAPIDCGPAIAAAERERGTASGLLAAIGLVESGRTDPRTHVRAPWPWTVTAEGVGTYFPGKVEAMRATETLWARGVKSIDVGCMQVNLAAHPTAFRDLEQAFDPAANAMYAARFLSGLYGRLGTWPAAAAAYHSMTPALGAQYGRLVAAVWGGAPVPTVAAAGGAEVILFPGGGQMRLMRDSVAGPGRVTGYLTGP